MKAPAHPGSTSGEEEEPARRRARTHVRAAAPCARTVAGRGPGRERPGGGGRAARVGRSSLSPSAERLARASGQTVAALLCPLGREILGAVESAQCRHPLPAHQDTCPCEAARPTTHSPAKSRCGTTKGVSPSFSGVWRPGVGPFAASWPLRGDASQRRASPPAPCQLGAQRGHSSSFGRTQRVPRKRKKWVLPHTRDARKSKAVLSRINPETFQRAGHESLVRGCGGRGGLEGTAGAPPTSRAISFGLLASLRAQIPDSFGPQNSPLRSLSSASPDGAPALSLNTFQTDPQTSKTSPHSSPSRARSRRPRAAPPPPRTSPLAGSDARLPLLLLVSCHCRGGPLGLQAPGLHGRWGLQPLPSLWPSPSPWAGPVLQVPSAPHSQVEVCGRLARCGGGGWRKVTGRNLHEEAGSGNGVGGGCQTQKEGSEKEIKVPFSLEKESLFWVFKKKKRRRKKWLERRELEESGAGRALPLR